MKQKLVTFLMALFCTLWCTSAWADVTTTTNFTLESGAYHIKNLAGLNEFATNVNGGETFSGETVYLDADIDMSSVDNFTPIGNADKTFKGYFDGGNHTISNLKITSSTSYTGLFGHTHQADGKKTIYNLTVKNANVTITDENTGDYAGIIVAHTSAANIYNCHVIGGTLTGYDQVGAIAGMLGCGSITNCTVDGVTIHAKNCRAGGVVGKTNIDNQYMLVDNTVSNTTVSAVNTYSGMRSAAALDGQVIASTNGGTLKDLDGNALSGCWYITDNNIINVTTSTGTDNTFVPIGEFRNQTSYSAAITTNNIVRNHWEPATTPDSYIMVNPSNTSEGITIENYNSNGYSGNVDTKGTGTADANATVGTQTSTVEGTSDASVETVKENIAKTTTVTGVLLTTTAAEGTSGVQAVVNAVKTSGSSDFQTALASATQVNIKVDVKVTPSNYTADKTISFALEPVATVTVGTGAAAKTATTAVTNDMIDQTKDITVNIYTGFQPALVRHTANDGTYNDITGDGISYNSTTGVTTVKINHFSTLTAYANAADADATTYVAQIGDTKYETLAEAVAAAQENETIQLLSDVDLTSTQTIAKSLTLDLNGKNITATDARALWQTEGTLTITGTGTISAAHTEGNTSFKSSSSVIRVGDNAGTAAGLVLGENVTVSTDYCYGITYFGTDAQTVTINGKVAVTGEQTALSGNGTSTLGEATVTVNGTVSSANEYAIYKPEAGTLTINGTVTGKGGVEIKAGSLVVASTAKITATATEQTHNAYSDGCSTSGYAIAEVLNQNYKGVGTITVDANATITGEKAYGDNKINDYVAQIGTKYYPTLAEAITAANLTTDATITLLANCNTDADCISIEKNMTIDLGGFTLNDNIHNHGRVFKLATANVTFTIQNGTIYNYGTSGTNGWGLVQINAGNITLNITDVTFTGAYLNNTAYYTGGAAVICDNSTSYANQINLTNVNCKTDFGFYQSTLSNDHVYGEAELNVTGGSYEVTGGGSKCVFGSYGKSTFTDVTITSNASTAIRSAQTTLSGCTISSTNTSKGSAQAVDISGGNEENPSVVDNCTITSTYNYGLATDTKAYVQVKNSTIQGGKHAIHVNSSGGSFSIEEGNTLIGGEAALFCNTEKQYQPTESKINVVGADARINGNIVVSSNNTHIYLAGGIYSVDPSTILDSTEGQSIELKDGYMIIANPDETTKATYPYMVVQECKGTVYAGTSEAQTGKTLSEFATIRETTPNAIMIVDEEYYDLVKEKTNVIVKYSVGKKQNQYFYECPKFVLTDIMNMTGLAEDGTEDNHADFYTPVDFIAVSGSYTRSIPVATDGSGRTSTCCLPFALDNTIVTKGKILTFAYYEPIYKETFEGSGIYEQDGTKAYAYFNKRTSIDAGTPCLLYTTEAYNLTATFANTEIVANPDNSTNMQGTYQLKTFTGNVYGVSNSGTQLAKATNGSVAFRSVLSLDYTDSFNGGSNHTTTSSNAPASLEIVLLDEETGVATDLNGSVIENYVPEAAEGNSAVYSVDGKLLGNEVAAPGLYIINGKVQFICK